MTLDEIEKWRLERIRKKIKLKEIADALRVSSALISRFERKGVPMGTDKIRKYKEFIQNYK
ncbi:XRE family transcriptional regulator [Parageobacillus sp. G301]|uniref:XRE family transcriptional regulator n=1 Tax=Parageobacillus sp. G301 TaxID=2998290 RepID=UPI0024964099|nr:XRE family transcriptional regulator [Parageobacillus sp. G301]GLH62390.1 hypothetical protein PG301_02300 [Parageobacillus sp. G301]